MKVLFVYKYLTVGGVETVLRARIDGLARWGIDADAWFFHDLGGRGVFAGREERVTVDGVEACAAAASAYDLLATIDSEEILPALPAGRTQPKLVVECHSPYVESLEYLRQLHAHDAAAVLVPSHHQKLVVEERLRRPLPVLVVPNPLRDVFAGEPRPFEPPPTTPVVAWVGRLDELKNWRGFLALGESLLGRGADAELWLAGRSPAPGGAAELAAEASRRGVLPRLRWWRGVAHDRVPVLLDAVRDSGGVLVSTSLGDSFGMTVAEGMARRCAVAAPRRTPFSEFVTDGRSGALYDPGAIADDGAARVAELLRDGGQRAALGIAARESVLARHAPDAALRELARTLHAIARTELPAVELAGAAPEQVPGRDGVAVHDRP